MCGARTSGCWRWPYGTSFSIHHLNLDVLCVDCCEEGQLKYYSQYINLNYSEMPFISEDTTNTELCACSSITTLQELEQCSMLGWNYEENWHPIFSITTGWWVSWWLLLLWWRVQSRSRSSYSNVQWFLSWISRDVRRPVHSKVLEQQSLWSLQAMVWLQWTMHQRKHSLQWKLPGGDDSMRG